MSGQYVRPTPDQDNTQDATWVRARLRECERWGFKVVAQTWREQELWLDSQGHVCHECRDPFTIVEWDNRHSATGGEDVHEACCLVCEPEALERAFMTGAGTVEEYRRRQGRET